MPKQNLKGKRVGGRVAHPHPGKRTIGGKEYSFRSLWEVNYAWYLEFLKQDPKQDVKDWEYEPRTFWFNDPNNALGLKGICRGVTNYTPDFKVTYWDGRIVWFEVKGYMDPRSKTKITRMGLYYPEEVLTVVDEKSIKAITKWASIIPGWEYPESGMV